VVTENQRVLDFVDACRLGDLAALGPLLAASHASLRDDFEVSTPALDQLVDRLVATPGILGARLTGAGFGGCAVALCEPGTAARVVADLGGWHLVPSAGARLVSA
jgi:galactokinase